MRSQSGSFHCFRIFIIVTISFTTLLISSCYNLYDMGKVDTRTGKFVTRINKGYDGNSFYSTDPIRIFGYPPYDQLHAILSYSPSKDSTRTGNFFITFNYHDTTWYFIEQVKCYIDQELFLFNNPYPTRYMSGSMCVEKFSVHLDNDLIEKMLNSQTVVFEIIGMRYGSQTLTGREMKQMKDFIIDIKQRFDRT